MFQLMFDLKEICVKIIILYQYSILLHCNDQNKTVFSETRCESQLSFSSVSIFLFHQTNISNKISVGNIKMRMEVCTMRTAKPSSMQTFLVKITDLFEKKN
jgi:hypothetical protein